MKDAILKTMDVTLEIAITVGICFVIGRVAWWIVYLCL